jgi:hypothetical protein
VAAAPANGSAPLAAAAQEAAPPQLAPPPERFVPTPEPVAEPPKPKVPAHPYGEGTRVWVYHPKNGDPVIVFPHISTCEPTTVFFYDHRHDDDLKQAFAWMDLCGIPDSIGRRIFLLPAAEQGSAIRAWFAGLELTPQGVAPPGES